MRWGVREEASIDHSTSELCLKEIKACNELSLGPTFVVRSIGSYADNDHVMGFVSSVSASNLVFQTLLSHRYGYRPLPSRIPEAEMNLFIDQLKQRSQEDLDLVMTWYQRDENAIPPEYTLKVRCCWLRLHNGLAYLY